MRHQFTRLATTIAGAALLLGASLSGAAAGFQLTISNQCNGTIEVATHAVEPTPMGDRTVWMTRGWHALGPGQSRTIDLKTNHQVYYLHARAGRLQWGGAGKPGSIQQYVYVRGFVRPEGGQIDGYDWKLVSFFKKQFPAGATQDQQNFTCG